MKKRHLPRRSLFLLGSSTKFTPLPLSLSRALCEEHGERPQRSASPQERGSPNTFKSPVAVVVPGARHLHELVEQRLPSPGQHLGDAVLSAPGAPRQEGAGGRDESGGDEARGPQPPAARIPRTRVPPCAAGSGTDVTARPPFAPSPPLLPPAPYLPCRRRSPPPVRRRAATAAIAAERCARRAALGLPGRSEGRSESGRCRRTRCGGAWCTWT